MPKVPRFGLVICAVIGGFFVIQFGEFLFPESFSGEIYVEFIIGCGIGALARYLFVALWPKPVADARRGTEERGS